MSTIHLETLIRAPAPVCFDLARNIDFHLAASRRSGERAVNGVTSGLIGDGETVTWEGRHFLIRFHLTSRIIRFDFPNLFADEMQSGPFNRWRHTHRFVAEGDQTRMIDDVEFASPLGIAGRLVDYLILNRYMTNFLLEHNSLLKKYAEQGITDNFPKTEFI